MYKQSCRTMALLLALFVPALALAAPRISVGPVRGDKKATISRQLASELCRNFQCIPPSRAFTRAKPDLKKMRKQHVAGALTGAVVKKKRAGPVLVLSLYTARSNRPARTWTFPLTRKGALVPDDLGQVSRDLDEQVGAPPPRAAPPPAEARREPPPPPPPPPAQHAAPDTEPSSPPPARTSEPDPDLPSATTHFERKKPAVAVEVGGRITNRHLSYSGANDGTSVLSEYKVGAYFSPDLRLEFYPLAFATNGIASGVGVFGGYHFSLGLKSEQDGSSNKNSTSATRLQAGLLWRIPVSASGITLIPMISYEKQTFTVSPSFSGLPDADLSGLRGGLNVEIPVGPTFAILAGAGYVNWSTAKDLIKGDPSFFPGGSAHALEAELGFSAKLSGPLSLRVLGEYSSTSYSLDTDTTGTYVATGATDTTIGGRAVLRAQF